MPALLLVADVARGETPRPRCRLFNTATRELIAPRHQGAAANITFSDSRGRSFPDLSAAHFQCGSPPVSLSVFVAFVIFVYCGLIDAHPYRTGDRYFLCRENQRNPVTTNNARFRISGQSVPVFSSDRPKQPQSMLKPRTMALSKAPENMVSRIATHTSAPPSHRPSRRLIPTHNSKAGRKTDNTAVAGHGVS